MKLQLDENTLRAYINEAILEELNEAIKVDFEKLGQPMNQQRKGTWNRRYFSLDKQKKDLQNGTFGKYLVGRGSKDAIQVLKDLGYDDEQIKTGIRNGVIRIGRNFGTGSDNQFLPHDNLRKQNRRDARLRSNAGMPVQEPNQAQNIVQATSYPWDDTEPEWAPRQQKKQQPVSQQTAPAAATQQTSVPRNVGPSLNVNNAISRGEIGGQATTNTGGVAGQPNNNLSLQQSAAKTMVQAPELAGRTRQNAVGTGGLSKSAQIDLKNAQRNINNAQKTGQL